MFKEDHLGHTDPWTENDVPEQPKYLDEKPVNVEFFADHSRIKWLKSEISILNSRIELATDENDLNELKERRNKYQKELKKLQEIQSKEAETTASLDKKPEIG